ncbi:MAG: hypothetical protein Q8Q36_01140 [bacterium]|nr:hypothetical protein [bacterium]
MFKEFFLKKLLESKLKALPESEREKLMKAMLAHPEFFAKVAGEIKEKMAEGYSETDAAREVMEAHRDEFQKLLT